jgi:hypothetical protein
MLEYKFEAVSVAHTVCEEIGMISGRGLTVIAK